MEMEEQPQRQQQSQQKNYYVFFHGMILILELMMGFKNFYLVTEYPDFSSMSIITVTISVLLPMSVTLFILVTCLIRSLTKKKTIPKTKEKRLIGVIDLFILIILFILLLGSHFEWTEDAIQKRQEMELTVCSFSF